METFENIKTRRSVRSYSHKKVDDELVLKVIEAAMFAPSSGNARGWEFIVVRDDNKKNDMVTIHTKNEVMAKAPVCVVVCYDLSKQKYADRWMLDSAAACQNMLLAANDLGLGSLWIDIFPDEFRCDGMKSIFGIPEGVAPFGVICLGYPKSAVKCLDRFEPEKIHREMWRHGAA